jgi:hypothetical protein
MKTPDRRIEMIASLTRIASRISRATNSAFATFPAETSISTRGGRGPAASTAALVGGVSIVPGHLQAARTTPARRDPLIPTG